MKPTVPYDRQDHPYRVFDLCIRSNLPLLDVADPENKAVDWSFEFQRAPLPGGDWTWIHDWRDPGGGLQLSCARNGPEYRLRFPDLADFQIDFERARVIATAPSHKSEQTVVQVFLDQVLPRVLFHAGRLVVHASAVTTADGRCAAFFGPSGAGKSTLAASYLGADATVLTDDCLLLRKNGPGFDAIAAYPALRLWPDSVAALGTDGLDQLRTTLESGKTRLTIAPPAGNERSTPLSALFFLAESASAQEDEVTIEPLTGNKAMMSLIESAFVLDLASKEAIRNSFTLVSSLARSDLPMFTLNYPRRYDSLNEVQRAISAVLAPSGHSQ